MQETSSMQTSSTADDSVAEEAPKPVDTTVVLVVYALMLAGFVVGFTPLIGVIVAYVYRGKGPDWLDEHYRYQIRTFWIGMLYALIASLLTLIGVGLILMVALAIWLIVRCVKGFKAVQEKRAPSKVETWLW